MITENDYLLTSIFMYLPPKSLIRFQLVCKHWLSLITSDYISHQHTLHHRHRPKPEHSFLLRLSDETSNFFYLCSNQKLLPYHFSPPLIEQTISSFSNGLFLLKCNPLLECHIYNPATKQSREIVLDCDKRFTLVVGLNLAFDPSKSPHYKIVCVRSARKGLTGFLPNWCHFCRIQMYESETGAWRISGEPFWAPTNLNFNRDVYLNGCVHWAGMFFNLIDGTVSEHPKIEVPGGSLMSEDFHDKYVESCGYLHYIAHFPKRNSVMVFELERDYSEWSLKYNVDLNSFPRIISVLGFVRGGSNEDCSLVLHEPGKVMAYELEEKECKELVDFRDEAYYEEGRVQFVSNDAFRFVETLARV